MRRPLIKLFSVQVLLVATVLAAAGSAQAPGATLAEANAALQAGEADRTLDLVASLPQGGAQIAEAENLQCRAWFAMAQWDAAINTCQQAVQLDEQESEYHLWLGRALGEKAGQASFLIAYSLGKRVLAEFETAVRLDPRNAEALADLGEYYVEAPALVGGGLSKAESVADELDRVDPAHACELRARIDEQRNDYGAAERELKQAIVVSPHPAREWATLARFYETRKRWSDMDDAIRNCIEAAARDRNAGVALYDAAGVLISARRDPELAGKMLGDYLASADKTDEAPAFVAYVRLARLKQELGDNTGAQQDNAAALALAREYIPARDLRR